MMSVLAKLLDWVRIRLPGRRHSDLRWWERSVSRIGPRAVLHHGHSDDEVETVTEWQKRILFPLLRDQLRGNERVVLDFGCGPGRFTPALAELVDGRAVGVDPIRALVERAPRHEHVEYRVLRGSKIPLDDASVDVVWVGLVLMCITDEQALRETVREIERVLRPDGLLFLFENTQERPDLRHLRYRTVDAYKSLFPHIRLQPVGEYHDLGERISVLAGRRRAGEADGRK